MAQKHVVPLIPLEFEWETEYPAERIPDGLRPETVTGKRTDDNRLVPCKVYQWKVVIAGWNSASSEWELSIGSVVCERALSNGGEFHSTVLTNFNQGLDRRLWRKWGPFRWALLKPPAAPERKNGGPPAMATVLKDE